MNPLSPIVAGKIITTDTLLGTYNYGPIALVNYQAGTKVAGTPNDGPIQVIQDP